MNSVKPMAKVIIMAGGTGGHIFPGLAVAEELIARGWQASWLGSKGGMEEHLVNFDAIELHLISIAGLRGKGILGWIKAPFSLSLAVFQAVRILRQVKPELVIGFGGFASGPGGLAAWLTRTPLVIHEQNAIAGMTNRALALMAKKVFQGFPGAFSFAKKVETVGNPIRKEIELLAKVDKAMVTSSRPVNILIVGGSRGALALNRNVPFLFADLIQKNKVKLRHQVGKSRLKETTDFYRQVGIEQRVELSEFIDDMAQAFNWADLVIARAGASTVAEVAAVGVGAVFVPFPYAVDDHQTANAAWLVDAKAAICIAEKDLPETSTAKQISQLVQSPETINQMSANAKQVAYLGAASKVADYCDAVRKVA